MDNRPQTKAPDRDLDYSQPLSTQGEQTQGDIEPNNLPASLFNDRKGNIAISAHLIHFLS